MSNNLKTKKIMITLSEKLYNDLESRVKDSYIFESKSQYIRSLICIDLKNQKKREG